MSTRSRIAVATALVTAAVYAPAAQAMPAQPVTSGHPRGETIAVQDARGEHAASLSETPPPRDARGEHAASLSGTRPALDLRTADAREPGGGADSVQPVVVQVAEPVQPGFDWTDAGIGAMGGLALTVLFGTSVVLARRRAPRPTAS